MKSEHLKIMTGAVSDALVFYHEILSGNISVNNKTVSEKESPRDLVTSMDFLIQDFMEKKLADTGIPLLSEEGDFKNFDLENNEYWVLDPIDGTTNYAFGIKYFGIALGLIQNSVPVAGVFGMPESKELFYMIDSDIAYCNEVRLSKNETKFENELVAVSFSSRKTSTEDERVKEYSLFGKINDSTRGALRMGSASGNICYTAMNKFGSCYGLKSYLWDIAAGLAIAKAAGCTIYLSEMDDQMRLSYIIGSSDAATKIRQELEENLNVKFKEGVL